MIAEGGTGRDGATYGEDGSVVGSREFSESPLSMR